MLENTVYDIAIIGAGPIGLFTAFQAGMLNLKCIIIDANSEIGGQCNALYPEKPIYDIPGHPSIAASELINQLSKQNSRFNPTYLLNSKLINIVKNSQDVFELETIKMNQNIYQQEQNISQNEKLKKDTMQNENFAIYTIYAKTVILATGGGSLEPKKLPKEIADINLENKNIFYAIKNLDTFFNKDVLIAGGGDSAIDWALNILELNKDNNNFYLIHRRDKFTAIPDNVNELKKKLASKNQSISPLLLGYVIKNVSIIDSTIQHKLENRINNLQYLDKNKINNTLKQINTKENNKLLVELENINSGEILKIVIDYLLPFYGLEKDSTDFKKWGLITDKNAILVDQHMQTNILGIFAVGDCAAYETKLKLILTGFSESSIACHAIYKLIHGAKPKHEYSTCKKF
ncbi:MAG: NAD(P)/FAD-dependent oxidoreductase [Rickettsiales bacterium]